MTKSTRARYTLEFKEEAVRLVTCGERVATVARNLGLSEQTLHNWVKAAGNGGLKSSATPAGVLHGCIRLSQRKSNKNSVLA
jgi:transposase